MDSSVAHRTSKVSLLMRFLPIISLIIPLVILHYLDPALFEATWKGRTFHLFFIWLICLETILNWEKLHGGKLSKIKSPRTLLFALSLTLPTIYVMVANFWGLNKILLDLATRNKIFPESVRWVPLFTEYLMFTVLFTLIVLLEYGIPGLTEFSISIAFQGLIGIIYAIDTLYPFGRFTPFQMLVPATATLASSVLNLMGYATTMSAINNPIYGSITRLAIESPQGKSARFDIAWPCSGVESLIIYTVTILLFLKDAPINWKHKTAYFAIGATITYLINILRIVTIFQLAIDYGMTSPQVDQFHKYYGQLYSITWIISYPLIVIGSQVLWRKIKTWRRASIKELKPPDYSDVHISG